ncbi:MAG: hypothetical protein AAFW70_27945 [Cyanobacteria bacterium J06635_10]
MRLFKLAALTTAGIFTAIYVGNTALARNRYDSRASDNNCITREDVIDAQQTWGNAIVAIGKAEKDGEDFQALAEETVDTLYAYDEGDVLFKPTQAAQKQFRLTEEDALSYFVGGNISEDGGFALQPWSNVRFENAVISLDCDRAMAMGNYFFKDAHTGEETKVEYTFGYRQDDDGKLLINQQHSSLPFTPSEQ